MQTFTLTFLAALTLATAAKLWLGVRHLNHIQRHRDSVPTAFADEISLDAHHRAADYSCAKTRLALVSAAFECALILALTFGGGLDLLHAIAVGWFAPGIARGVALIVLLAIVMAVVDIPFGWYRTFGIEQRFGFNKMTPLLFLADILKHAALAAALGIPLIACVLWVMEESGDRWWLYAWLIWVAFNLIILAVYPTWIAPLFNRFSPLNDPQLKERIERLITKCGFKVQGLMVMDGSRRSSHGNAYFTGFGKTKRIVFFDTLLSRLGPSEIEAVLAHELGHFKLKHVVKRIIWIFAASLAFLWMLAQLMNQGWFYSGLNVQSPSTAMALILFSIVVPQFIFLLQPVMSAYSRKHEFEADEYAARHASVTDLVSALVKLYKDNAATLTPDPLHSAFYDSHPPAALRIARLQATRPCTFHPSLETLMTAPDLAHTSCKPCEAGVSPLKPEDITRLLKQLDGWEYRDGVITKAFEFKNYYQTMAFVNAVAWISHREDHHPDLTVGYNKCRVEYSTHAIAGLSENDFICAAKLDALLGL